MDSRRGFVVLVNAQDEQVGLAEKMAAHETGQLHRAMSVMMFDKNAPHMVLLQQRAATKYHAPLMWANACCSHPFEGEDPTAGMHRRLKEELGLEADAPLDHVAGFVYRRAVGDLVEHEFDHLHVSFMQRREIPFSRAEVHAVEWVDAGWLLQDLARPTRDYAPWLELFLVKALQAARHPVHAEILEKYGVRPVSAL